MKLKELNQEYQEQTFRLIANLKDEAMQNFIAFTRYIVIKKEEENWIKFQKQKDLQNTLKTSKETRYKVEKEMLYFKGHLNKISLKNEISAWSYIVDKVTEILGQYQTTLEEDIDMLKQDEMDPKLSTNKKNCIIYRKNEKVVLHYILECSKKVGKIKDMTVSDAKQEIKTWPNKFKGKDYFL